MPNSSFGIIGRLIDPCEDMDDLDREDEDVWPCRDEDDEDAEDWDWDWPEGFGNGFVPMVGVSMFVGDSDRTAAMEGFRFDTFGFNLPVGVDDPEMLVLLGLP